MSDKCKCWDEKLELMKEHIIPQLPKHEDLSVQWQGYSYFMGGDFSPVNAQVDIKYRGFKKNDERKAKMDKNEMFLTFDFCPFCGRKYNKSEE